MPSAALRASFGAAQLLLRLGGTLQGMTLIISVLTPSYVLQVSDKRVTSIADGSLIDDDRVKAVQYCNQMLFSYSGVAELAAQPFHEWLVDVLAERPMSLEDAVSNLQQRLNGAFESPNLPAQRKRHAVVGVGWAEFGDSEELSPFKVVVSNSVAADGRWKRLAEAAFAIQGQVLESHSLTHLSAIGAAVPPTLRRNLTRNVERLVERSDNVLELIRLVAMTIRSVAAINATVGSSMTAMVLPKNSVKADSTGLWSPPNPLEHARPDSPVFFHLAADSDQLTRTLPAHTCFGYIMYGGSVTRGDRA